MELLDENQSNLGFNKLMVLDGRDSSKAVASIYISNIQSMLLLTWVRKKFWRNNYPAIVIFLYFMIACLILIYWISLVYMCE